MMRANEAAASHTKHPFTKDSGTRISTCRLGPTHADEEHGRTRSLFQGWQQCSDAPHQPFNAGGSGKGHSSNEHGPSASER